MVYPTIFIVLLLLWFSHLQANEAGESGHHDTASDLLFDGEILHER